MEPVVHDMLNFYHRELLDGENPGSDFLKRNNLLDATLIEDLGLGYASGKLKEVAGPHQTASLKRLGLMKRQDERFHNCLVIPVRNREGQVVDIFGYRLRSTDIRPVTWKSPPRGMLGGRNLGQYADMILCEIPLYFLKCLSLGLANAVAMRSDEEAKRITAAMVKHGVKTVRYMGTKKRKTIFPLVENHGIEIAPVAASEEGEHHGTEYLSDLPAPRPLDALTLTRETETHLFFTASGTEYRIERGVVTTPARNAHIRSERDGRHVIDRADFTSAQSRSRFAKLAAPRLQMPVSTLEEHLAEIADRIDRMHMERMEGKTDEEAKLDEKLEKEARRLLSRENLLEWFASAMAEGAGYAGEEDAKRLAVLIAASRLLPEPTGGCVRGPSGCGKSSLIGAAAKLLPASQVLLFSRLTPQALYFLPRDMLMHRLLVVDEYEGMEAAEYAVRTLMSSQTLAMASTVKDGGSLPVTKTMAIPARLAVLVTTTGAVNPENLSRFIEIGLDASPRQNIRVLRAMAEGNRSEERVRLAKAMNTLLRPCRVEVPFAARLSMGGCGVEVRRRFSQILTLVKAHAAMHQHQRDAREEDGVFIVTATLDDYRAVYPLIPAMREHAEEDVSPNGMALLRHLRDTDICEFSREDVMRAMNWSYSRAYRTLKELTRLELLSADQEKNGVKRLYAVTHLAGLGAGMDGIVTPEQVAQSAVVQVDATEEEQPAAASA